MTEPNNTISSPPEANREKEVLKKIDSLELIIKNMSKIKKKAAISSYIGVAIVVILLIVFLFHIISFIKNYDTDELAIHLNRNAITISKSKQAIEVLQVIEKKLLPDFKTALISKVKSSAPLFVQSSQNLKIQLQNYLTDYIQPKLQNSIQKELLSSENLMLSSMAKHKISPEKIERVVQLSEDILAVELSKSLDNHLNNAMLNLTELNESFNNLYETSLKNDIILKGITPEMTNVIEKRLIESMLELVIYQLNPQKGNLPAFAKGGLQ